MDATSMKFLAAGIAMLAAFGAAIGLGNIFAAHINATARNPGAEPKFRTMTYIGAAMTELVLILSFVVSMILLFAV